MDNKKCQILRSKSPQMNKIAKGMIFCKQEAKKYAICVSGKGITVNQHECQAQFTQLMSCLGRTPKLK